MSRKFGTPSSRTIGHLATNKQVGKNSSRNKDRADGQPGTEQPSSDVASSQTPHVSSTPISQSADDIAIKIESDSDEGTSTIGDCTCDNGNPDLFWIKEWNTLDLRSAVASQVEFFKTSPRFDKSQFYYITFFMAIHRTLHAAKKDPAVQKDETARADLKSLRIYFEDYEDTFRGILWEQLDAIKRSDYNLCDCFKALELTSWNQRDFLNRVELMVLYLDLVNEWTEASDIVKCLIQMLAAFKQGGSADKLVFSLQDVQPAEAPLHMAGPLSPEMLKMNYEFTDDIWCRWIMGCIAYFAYWTADSARKLPSEKFLRHLSHYRLAMELFIRHKSVSEERRYTLLKFAKKYMLQYRDHAAMKLEKTYARLKEDVKSAGIYLTEAHFWSLAGDVEVLLNEPPLDITIETWDDAVPSLLPRDKVLAAKNAVNILYNEFQMKRYPEDEVSYLWSLTWRNIKHTLPYLVSPIEEDGGRYVTIEARDLALPFVEKNLSQLLTIIRKDNDALYQKEIESLVADYCAHIDRYVKGVGEGQTRIYEQFSRLSNTKRVSFVYLVMLEESLLKQGVKPSNESQIVAHRVVKRLNHIMEGPKNFERWEITETGEMKTYSPTSTWIREQNSLNQAAGFNYDNMGLFPSSPSYGPSQSPKTGNGAGGNDDGDSEKRDPTSGGNDESSSSDEEVEVISAGGTKHKMKVKKARKAESFVDAETLTKAKLEQLAELAKGPDSDPKITTPGFQAANKDEEEEDTVMSGCHLVPADSLDYHRRRLKALREQEVSAVSNAQYPLPETAAPQRAAALQIAREVADPGIFTDGPRPEDVQNYINPALRLPSVGEEIGNGEKGMLK